MKYSNGRLVRRCVGDGHGLLRRSGGGGSVGTGRWSSDASRLAYSHIWPFESMVGDVHIFPLLSNLLARATSSGSTRILAV